MLFQRSSSSSSSEENPYEEIDDVIDNFYTHHLPVLIQPPTPPPPRKKKKPQNTDDSEEFRMDRNREEGHQRLYNDYFAINAVYTSKMFRRRFRMRKHVFQRIMDAVVAGDKFFQQRPNATGRLGLSPLQKCTAAIRMLAYGVAADAVDEYLRLGETTARRSLSKFCEGVIKNFGEEYLRSPTAEDLRRMLEYNDNRGFPGMVGSIDCMHWEWKNCPAAWKAQYQGYHGVATLILEAVAGQDLWIWHAFFGIPGSCNDLNVLYRSPVFDDVLHGRAPPINFVVNGHQYNMGYYLTDGIYPNWATFIQGITHPQTDKQRLFATKQASARKDVERAFGVLQSRFAIIRQPSLAWDEDILSNIMTACIIMHNMIVEDERDTYVRYDVLRKSYEDIPPRMSTTGASSSVAEVNNDEPIRHTNTRPFDLDSYLAKRDAVRDKRTHLALKADLMEHIWQRYGPNNP